MSKQIDKIILDALQEDIPTIDMKKVKVSL